MSMLDLHVDLTLKLHLLSNIFEISSFRFGLEKVARGDSYHCTKWKQELVLRQAAKSYIDSSSKRNRKIYVSGNHRYSIDFENRINFELSMSNRCHPFQNDSCFIIDEIWTSF